MKKVLLSYISALFFMASGIAQTGIIDNAILQQIKSALKKDPYLKATQNAIANNDIKKLAESVDKPDKPDHYFSNKVKTKGITDQKSSGRCWLFTGQNILRPIAAANLNVDEFQFSQAYNFFYDQLEKSNMFLEAMIVNASKPIDDRLVKWWFDNALGDGGQWTGVVNIIEKYGLVPACVMPETNSANNTRHMSSLIGLKLKEHGYRLREMAIKGSKAEELKKKKIEMLTEIYRMLVINLGEPPEQFTFRYEDKDKKIIEKTFTPLQFYKEVVGINLQDYIMFMDDPSREYYKIYEVENDKHIIEGMNWKYINLPAKDFKPFAKAAILDNQAMYFSCDVSKQLNSEKGYLDLNNYDYESLFGVTFGMNKKERILTGTSGSSHAMTLVGVDIDANGNIKKWLVENSWGTKSGNNGYLTMTDQWFDEYMFRIVINKKYVSPQMLKILEQKPILLPPWDPMFAPEE